MKKCVEIEDFVVVEVPQPKTLASLVLNESPISVPSEFATGDFRKDSEKIKEEKHREEK
jgi:hypothetical protein